MPLAGNSGAASQQRFSGPRLLPRDLPSSVLGAASDTTWGAADDDEHGDEGDMPVVGEGGSSSGGAARAAATAATPNVGLALAVLPPAHLVRDPGAQSTLALVQQKQIAAHQLAVASEAKLHESAIAGIAKVLDAMREHLWLPAVQEAGLVALRNLALKLGSQRVPEVAADAVRACVAAMGAHPALVAIQEHALSALRAFCKLADPSDIYDIGVEAVVALAGAHEGLAPLLELSFRTLADLLDEEDFSLRAVEKALALGTLEVIARAMQLHSGTPGLQEKCLDVLHKMLNAQGIKDEHRARAVSAGIVMCALEALRQHLDSPVILLLACKVLRQLTSASDDAAASAAASGGSEAIVVALRAHRSDAPLAEAGAAAMRTLLGSKPGKARAVDGGALETLCLAMFAFPDERGVQAACAGALKSLAVIPAARSRRATAAAIEGLTQALRTFGGDRAGDQAAAGDKVAIALAADACGALANMMIDSPSNQERVASADGIAAVVDTMKAHVAGSAEVAEAGCAALWALATDSDSHTLENMAGIGACDVLVASIRHHPDDVNLHCLAGAGLRALCVLPQSANAAAATGAVDVVLESLRRHGASSALQEGLFDVLDVLCRFGGERIAVSIAAEGGHLVVQAAVTTRFPKHAGVLRAANALNVHLKPHAWQSRGSRLLT